MDEPLSFGKYKGKRLGDIPRSYVSWLARESSNQVVQQAAQQFLLSNPLKNSIPPRTYKEAKKLGWMAERNYSDARERLLACRDAHKLLVVIDEDSDDERNILLHIDDTGGVHEATFLSYENIKEVEALLSLYPVDPQPYLEGLQEELERISEERKRTLNFRSRNDKHAITLVIWDRNTVDVTIDDVPQGNYLYRVLEASDPRIREAEAILEPDEDDVFSNGGWRTVGLTKERRLLFEQKLQEMEKS